jgi:hypothetical protein
MTTAWLSVLGVELRMLLIAAIAQYCVFWPNTFDVNDSLPFIVQSFAYYLALRIVGQVVLSTAGIFDRSGSTGACEIWD